MARWPINTFLAVAGVLVLLYVVYRVVFKRKKNDDDSYDEPKKNKKGKR